MTLEWDAQSLMFQEIPKEMIAKPPRIFTFQTERFCPHCRNSQTTINNIKHLKKWLGKPSVIFLLEHIKKNNLNRFTIKELITSLAKENPDIRKITDGGLQRKILAVLVALGYFTKIIEEFEIEKGKNKKKEKLMRYIFIKKEEVTPPECYDVLKDKHKEVIWERKTYFDKKAQKKTDEEKND